MKDENKHAIQERLKAYIGRSDSQNKAAISLTDVSKSTVSNILNNKWDLISDEMWRKVDSQISQDVDRGWKIADTRAMSDITRILKDAKENKLVLSIKASAGTGKTRALENFARENKGVVLLKCGDYWNKRYFLQQVLKQLGRDMAGDNITDMVDEMKSVINRRTDLVLAIDEVDKLPDNVLYFLITIYNDIEDKCSIVLTATSYFEKRLKRGVRLNKKGYEEIWSRIGRKCIEVAQPNSYDITAVCKANGLTDVGQIKEVIEDSECDLRRVKRKVHAILKRNNG